MKRILSTALIPCFLLSGCASTENERAPEMYYFEKKIYEEDKRTNEVLSKASLLSAKALAVYVKTNQALKQGELTAEQIRQARAQNERVEINFEQIMETGYVGAPEPLIQRIATQAGYKLVYANERPPIVPTTLSLKNEKRTLKKYVNIIQQYGGGYIDRIDINDSQGKFIMTVWYVEM